MFAITRKIVYKWHGMGDGVRNGAKDEVLSVGWLGRSRKEERRGGGEREKGRWTVKKRVRKEPNGE